MARFLWNIYDEEDIENIAFTDDIFNECERIWELVCSKGNLESISSILDTNKFEIIREQDVCNIFKLYKENKSANTDELKEFSMFKSKVLLHRISLPYINTDFEEYVIKARDVMLEPDNLDPKGTVKQQLRMELMDRKCFCVVDALYMQSWKHINLQRMVSSTSRPDVLEDIVAGIHQLFYDGAMKRFQRLHECKRLVKYPLSGNMYGLWDSEVRKVVKYADLKRRSEGRRFIGKDHLVFYLHQMLVPESANKSELLETHAKNSKDLMYRDDEEKDNYSVYHLYKKAYEIAMELGHQKVRLEHLYVALTSGDDDRSSWKECVDCVRRVKAKRKVKCKQEGEPHPYLWTGLEDSKSKTRRIISGNAIDVVKKIKDESNTALQNAISDILYKVKESTHQMSQGEMINSLIEINRSPTPRCHKTFSCSCSPFC